MYNDPTNLSDCPNCEDGYVFDENDERVECGVCDGTGEVYPHERDRWKREATMDDSYDMMDDF